MAFRFSLAPLLALTAFAASAGVIWLAHIEAGEMTLVRTPPLVKASTQPLKASPEDPGGSEVADLGGVADLLRDRDQPAETEERLLPKPEQPVTPADGDGQTAGSLTPRSDEARAALEALVSEVRGNRPANGDPGIGGPNPNEPVNFPSPSRPPETVAALEPATTLEPTTPRAVSLPASDPPALVDAQPAETEVALVTPSFEGSPDGRFRVQLAAVREEEDARRAWALFQEQLGPFVSGMQPFFERAETSNGVFYRVQIGPFAENIEADRLCVELKKQEVSCFVVSR